MYSHIFLRTHDLKQSAAFSTLAFLLAFLFLTLAFLGLTPILPAPTAQAATTWTVTRTDDRNTASSCKNPVDINGCSLRETIANAATGDTIVFSPTVFSTAQTITLTNGTLSISKNLTIDASNVTSPTISGNNASRVLYINVTGVTIRLSKLIISNGSVNGPGGGLRNDGSTVYITNTVFSNNKSTVTSGTGGGAVYNSLSSGIISITGTTFFSNSAVLNGGGIANDTGSTAYITNTTFISNTATNNGGGLYNASTANLTNTTFSSNTSSGGNGGGLYNTSTVTITNSNFSNNKSGSNASNAGGGLFSNSGTVNIFETIFSGNSSQIGTSGTGTSGGGGMRIDSGTATITNSTFSNNIGNSQNSGGGGIYVVSGSSVTILNSTFSNNNARDGGGIYNTGNTTISNSTFFGNSGGNGGGIWTGSNSKTTVTNSTFSNNSASGNSGGIYNTSGGTANLKNTIIANSTSGGNCGGAGSGPITDGGYNLDDGTTCVFTATGSITNTNPLLSTIGNYGGSTQTLALLPGSPAINKIPNSTNGCGTTITTDQRGLTRPVSTNCDLGAFESSGFVMTITSGNNQSQAIGQVFTGALQVSLSSLNNTNPEPLGGGQVTFAGPLTGASTNPITKTATIIGSSASVTETANNTSGTYQVTASAAGANSVVFSLENYDPTAVTLAAFKASATSPTRVDVSWQTVSELDTLGFNLWRSTAKNGTYAQVNIQLIPSKNPGGIGTTTYHYYDDTITAGTTYYYKLEMVGTDKSSQWSNIASATVPSVCAIKPTKAMLQTPLNGTSVPTTQVNLDWADTACATRYELVVQTVSMSSTKQTVEQQTKLAASEYTTKALLRGMTYTWRVRACNVNGCGVWSAWSQFKISPKATQP